MMQRFSHVCVAAVAALGLSACATLPVASVSDSERAAIAARVMDDIRTLASDEFGGRKPGTPGETLTTDFMIKELQAAGFVSGTNDPGSDWLAPVPLVSTRPDMSRIVFAKGSKKTEFGSDSKSAVVFTSRRRNLVEEGDVLFVGKLGQEVPPEDVEGKVIVMLGEPGVSPARRAALFTKNPAAILTVIENDDAIANVRRFLGRDRIELKSEDPAQMSGYITRAAMAEAVGSEEWDALFSAAETDEFKPFGLEFKATVEATSKREDLVSNNVIGKLPGTKPDAGAVLLLGHWDHLGECGDDAAEDRVCNGAVDNASGIAVMLELARRLKSDGPFERDIYVMGTSAEEAGLLGARAFIQNPAMPLDTIVAAFNFDTVAVAPAGSTVGFIGEGETPLDALVREVVMEAGRELGDKEYANSFLRRQDGWALMQNGVPAVMISSAFSSQTVLGPYLSTDYHRASDEIDKIELGGAIEDLLLHEELIRRVANTAVYPAPAK